VRKEAKTLYAKAADSLVLAVDHFNRVWGCGRTEAVLIMLDRAFELLLKAIIVHRGGKIRSPDSNLTIGFDPCLRKCVSEDYFKLVRIGKVVSKRYSPEALHRLPSKKLISMRSGKSTVRDLPPSARAFASEAERLNLLDCSADHPGHPVEE
jgi:hypothetical protein